MRVLIAAERPQDRDQCRRAALRVGLDCASADCVDLADLRFRLARDPEIHFVVVYAAPDAQAAVKAIRAATGHSPRPVFAVVGHEPEARAAVAEAGAAGVWEPGQEKDALLAAAERLRQNGLADYRRGRLVAVTAALPGVGATTVATGLAFALAPAGPTVLTELWGGVPELALDLDLTPTHPLGDMVRESHRADPSMVRNVASAVPPGVDVLAYPAETLAAEPVTVEASRDFQILLRSMYDWVIADAGGGPAPGSDHLVRHAEAVVLVTRLDPPALRLTRRYARALTDAGVDPKAILVAANRYGQSGQVAWQKAEEALNRPVAAWLADDPRAVNRALGAGQPLAAAAGRSRLNRNLGQLADELRRRLAPAAR